MRVDLYRLSGEQWQLTQLENGDQLVLDSVGLELPVVDIYRDVIGGGLVDTLKKPLNTQVLIQLRPVNASRFAQ